MKYYFAAILMLVALTFASCAWLDDKKEVIIDTGSKLANRADTNNDGRITNSEIKDLATDYQAWYILLSGLLGLVSGAAAEKKRVQIKAKNAT